jgi:LysM domain
MFWSTYKMPCSFDMSEPCALRFRQAAQRARIVALAILVGCLAAGCSTNQGGGLSDRPTWSLADKPPVALGAKEAPAPAPQGPAYQYRGGRDPVTGKALTSSDSPSGQAAPPGFRTIEIRKGDTLHALSLTYRVSVKALMEANNLKTTTIQPGKKLIVPPPA